MVHLFGTLLLILLVIPVKNLTCITLQNIRLINNLVLGNLNLCYKQKKQDFINLNKAGSAFGQYIDWQVDEIQGKKLFSLMQTGNWSQFEFAAPIMDGHANSITIDSRLNNNFFQCRSRALALDLVSCCQYYCWPKCSKFYTRKNLVKLPQSNEI